MPKVLAPNIGVDDKFFWDGVEHDRLLFRRCAACHRTQHPPTPLCPSCGSAEWDVVESSGRGTIASWIVSRHPSEPDDAARIVILVDLEEGVRLVSNLVDATPDEARNHLAVDVVFREVDGVKLAQFRPTAEGAR